MAKYLDIELIVSSKFLSRDCYFLFLISLRIQVSNVSSFFKNSFNTVKMSFKGVLRLIVIVCAS